MSSSVSARDEIIDKIRQSTIKLNYNPCVSVLNPLAYQTSGDNFYKILANFREFKENMYNSVLTEYTNIEPSLVNDRDTERIFVFRRLPTIPTYLLGFILKENASEVILRTKECSIIKFTGLKRNCQYTFFPINTWLDIYEDLYLEVKFDTNSHTNIDFIFIQCNDKNRLNAKKLADDVNNANVTVDITSNANADTNTVTTNTNTVTTNTNTVTTNTTFTSSLKTQELNSLIGKLNNNIERIAKLLNVPKNPDEKIDAFRVRVLMELDLIELDEQYKELAKVEEVCKRACDCVRDLGTDLPYVHQREKIIKTICNWDVTTTTPTATDKISIANESLQFVKQAYNICSPQSVRCTLIEQFHKTEAPKNFVKKCYELVNELCVVLGYLNKDFYSFA